ncbi:MAG: phosphate acyltransferase PlsX [Rhodobacteraceae bacterium]|nr:phosphate acyltransferase PlsX [Paracoccaceae bacterium]
MAQPHDPDPDSRSAGPSGPVVISVDAMGGDNGPSAVIAGLAGVAEKDPSVRFIVHGPSAELAPLLARRPTLAPRVDLRDVEGVVRMTDKPSHVMRNGQGTSMWAAIDSVREGEAKAAVSCGNTGALMAVSMLRLRRLPGVNRPAIACLWPSRGPHGFNVMLDVGADIRAEAEDLLQYALMGVAYARNGLGIRRPRVGILNVGTEEHKGRAGLKEAHELISAAAAGASFDFAGFIEGGDLPSADIHVIVTDGFTGNIALKTGEGTAKLVGDFLRDAFNAGLMSRFAALLAMNSLKRLQRRIDPRRVNGGVFLGLNGTVIKSHGAADETGVTAAVSLAAQLARADFTARVAARIAQAMPAGQDGGEAGHRNGATE